MKNRNIFISAISVALIVMVSCGDSEHERNVIKATEAGYEFAGHYLYDEMSEMERQALLLDVRSREYQLRTEFGIEVADAFTTAFADSIGGI